MSALTVLNPTHESDWEDLGNVEREPVKIRNAEICVLDNKKPNAGILMVEIAERLVRDYGAASYSVERKLSPSQGAGAEQITRLAASFDIVITGSADCGSCTSWSARDAVALEKAGTNVVLLATDAFADLAGLLAERNDVPNLRMAVIPHPLGGRQRDNVLQLAQDAARSAADQLSGEG